MGRWRTHTEKWLGAEQQDRDEAAEAAFGPVFAALPVVEPSPAFVARAVEAAWAARARRRWLTGLAAAAAAALIVAASAVAVYTAFDGRIVPMLTMAASAASGSLLVLLTAGAALAGWWSAAVNTGVKLAAAMANPYSVAALTVIELVAAVALVMLHRLLRSEVDFRTPRAYCF